MRSRTTHQLDEMPVFTSGITIALYVSYQFTIGLTCSIKTKAGLNLLVLQVAVNSLGATNNLNSIVLSCVVLGQNTSIGIRVVSTNNDQSFDAKFTQNLNTTFKLTFFLQLCTSRTNDIKTTSIAIFVDESICKFYILMVNQTTRSHQETIQLAVRIERLHSVIKTTDNVVAARSLTTTKDDTYVEWLQSLLFASLKSNNWHTISIGEHGLNLILVTYTLGGCTLYSYYRTLQSLWKFGLIGSTSYLQCAFFHKLLNLSLMLLYYIFTFRDAKLQKVKQIKKECAKFLHFYQK